MHPICPLSSSKIHPPSSLLLSNFTLKTKTKKLASLISAAHILRCGAFYWSLIDIPGAAPLKPDFFFPRNDQQSIAPQLGLEVPEPLPCWDTDWFDIVPVLCSCWESMRTKLMLCPEDTVSACSSPDHYTQRRYQWLTDWSCLTHITSCFHHLHFNYCHFHVT